MCGLIGFASSRGHLPDGRRLDAGRERLAHRGPDGVGGFSDGQVYLGFRRLAILELSASGDQPMLDASGDVRIVFNGEIYNYVELRSGLEALGHRFRTRTDTEVLLALYRERGTDMFGSLNGMFAIGLYDRRLRRIILARDRFGKKPLFYWVEGGNLAFASELKALNGLPGVPTEIDPEAVNLYFRLGWIPNAFCIYKGVRKMAPSTWLEFDLASGQVLDTARYWSLPAAEYDAGPSEEEWVERVQALLWDATRIRLRSDVPLGTFLSGGIDSGLITAAAAAQCGPSLRALTIAFPGWEGDERALASASARHLGISPEVREVPAGEGISEALISHFDEPFSDVSAHPTSLVCQMARRELTVALSGDGGDEVFAGYKHHPKAWSWRHLESLPLSVRRGLSACGRSLTFRASRVHRMLRRLGQPVAVWGAGCTLDPRPHWISQYLRSECQGDGALERVLSSLGDVFRPGASPLDVAQRFDLRLYMLDDILVKVDRMSMLHSLEVRSPFLDHRLVELALSIPPRLRTRGGRNKHILRRLAEKHLPPEVACAPKQGFGVPLRAWLMEGPSRRRFREVVLSRPAQGEDPLRPGAAEMLWREAESRDQALHPLYSVFAFKVWQEGALSGARAL